jgi:hypothetical protein
VNGYWAFLPVEVPSDAAGGTSPTRSFTLQPGVSVRQANSAVERRKEPRQLIRRPLLWPYPRPVLLRVPANPTLKHGAKRCRRIRGERQVVVVGLLLQASNHADSSSLMESLPSPTLNADTLPVSSDGSQ